MKAYIAGPMRGRPHFNFPAFMVAEDVLISMGYDEVFNPARKDREVGFDPTGMEGTMEEMASAGFDLAAALRWDTDKVIEADDLILLPGWMDSAGAKAEYALARAMSKDIYELYPETDLYDDTTTYYLYPLTETEFLNV
jgi:hypothetical protein